jgi:hypothetical protein
MMLQQVHSWYVHRLGGVMAGVWMCGSHQLGYSYCDDQREGFGLGVGTWHPLGRMPL